MKPQSKSFVSALLVSSMLVSTIVGLKVRERQEMPDTMRVSPLMASNDGQIDIGEGDYYKGIVELLKDRYVDPVTDNDKLLSGAVRGLVLGLRDVDSQYFSPKEFEAFKSIRAGSYPGIGVWLDFKPMKTTIKVDGASEEAMLPKLAVISVAPGSSADKAGVKSGDVLEYIDGFWVTNTEELVKYRQVQNDFLAKKVDFKTLNELRKELRKKLDKSVTPFRARERAILGTSGTVPTTWNRNGKRLSFNLERKITEVPNFKEFSGAFILGFTAGAPAALESYLRGKSEVTLDLRNNVLGDFETMRKCLALVAPSGKYGYFETSKTPSLLSVENGNPKPPKVKLLVDSSTRDAAEIFAVALSSTGKATLSGGAMGDKLKQRDIGQLPDGSGYCVVTGLYKTGAPKVDAATTTTAQGKKGSRKGVSL